MQHKKKINRMFIKVLSGRRVNYQKDPVDKTVGPCPSPLPSPDSLPVNGLMLRRYVTGIMKPLRIADTKHAINYSHRRTPRRRRKGVSPTACEH